MGAKPIAEWRSTDYHHLGSQLGRQTKVYLSENTLKRIFGRIKTPERYYPQKATRDALARFIGYRDWDEFELIHRFAPVSTDYQQDVAPSLLQEKNIEVMAAKRNFFVTKKILIPGLLILILAVVFVYFFKNRALQPGDVRLLCENQVGSVPRTAVFKLLRSKKVAVEEQFTIDFMDEGPPVNISGVQEVAQFFKSPGVAHVRLLHDGKPIDTVAVRMETKGWVANSGNDSTTVYPINRLKAMPVNNLSVTAQQLDSAGLNLKKPFLLGFSNIHSSNISGDNFQFSCYLQTEESRPGVPCMDASIIILGSESRHRILISKANCIAFSKYSFSEVKVDGKAQNLTHMAHDFSAGGLVKLVVNKKTASLFINNKNVLKKTYTKTIGKVIGVKILFNGIGKLKSPNLVDLFSGETF